MSHDILLKAFQDHGRHFEHFVYAYPVLSRRAKGISLGLNISPHKACNFDCLYCQVDRSTAPEVKTVDMSLLAKELKALLHIILSGEIYKHPSFQEVPSEMRRLNDIALSGDGEPTSEPVFLETCELLEHLKKENAIDSQVKIVVISNSTNFHKAPVQRGLEILDSINGQIWAKLDAGTEAYYGKIDISRVPFQKIMENLKLVSKVRPVVIQTLFCEVDGHGPDTPEIDAYIERLLDILQSEGQISEIQIHTVARPPANHTVEALSHQTMLGIGQRVQKATGLNVQVYAGRKV